MSFSAIVISSEVMVCGKICAGMYDDTAVRGSFVFFLSARYQLRKERRVLRFVLAATVVAGKMLVGYLRIPPLNFISFA